MKAIGKTVVGIHIFEGKRAIWKCEILSSTKQSKAGVQHYEQVAKMIPEEYYTLLTDNGTLGITSLWDNPSK